MWAEYRSARECARACGGRARGKQRADSTLSRCHSRHSLTLALVVRPGMQTALALALLAAAASALARPPEPTPARVGSLIPPPGPHRQRAPIPETREFLLPRFLLPHFLGYDESPRMPPPPQRTLPANDWLNKEIDRINQMEESEEPVRPYDDDLAHWIARDPYLQRMFENSVGSEERRPPSLAARNGPPFEPRPRPLPNHSPRIPMLEITEVNKRPQPPKPNDEHKKFALTPFDKGYFEPEVNTNNQEVNSMGTDGSEGPVAAMVIEPPRQIRQNPNLSRTKTLVTENIDRLRTGLNSHEDGSGEKNREHIHVLESGDPVDPLFLAAVGGAIAAAVSLTIFGFTFAWYTLAKKAKAAADVDYPAYGVTGPNVDSSGDRKLAHSAHMYHYQHQKQQIIAMESRMDLEQRLGSVSDPESEEENEEGDYTVYECPGFATTGDMEVKNPLFSDEPTPATPGKCELVKPQPKD